MLMESLGNIEMIRERKNFIRKLVFEGYKLFPCDERNKPNLNLQNFQHEFKEFNERLKVKILQSDYLPSYNLAILTGELNQLIVLDVDVEYMGTSVWESILIRNNGKKDLDTFKVKTPGGGYHYYFSYDHQNFHLMDSLYRPTLQGIGKVGIDLIAENGYVMVPFSLKKEKQYLPVNISPYLDFRDHLKPMPDWLYLFFRNSKEGILNRITKKKTLKLL